MLPDSFFDEYLQHILPSLLSQTPACAPSLLTSLLQLNSVFIQYHSERLTAYDAILLRFAKQLGEHTNSAVTTWSIFFLCRYVVARQAASELARNAALDLAVCKGEQAAQHITVLKVAVVALDGLVQNRPDLLGAAALRGTPGAQKAECREPQRSGQIVEQRVLCTVICRADLLGMLRHEQRAGIEDLPARLGLGTVQRVDQVGDIGLEKLGFALCQQMDDARGELALQATAPRQVIDERRERITELNKAIAEMRPRLMPSGMEWPRFEDGEPVRIGDEAAIAGKTCAVSSVNFSDHCWTIAGGGGHEKIGYGERVKRPEKVLDADGAEIRVGDEVFVIETGRVHHVAAVDSAAKRFRSMEQMSGDSTWLDPVCFTHRAPVLAADGKPLREGETVYLTDSPTAFVVDDIMTREDGATIVHLKDGAWNLPQYLTHERPDSWERLEEDAEMAPYYYAEKYAKTMQDSNAAFQRKDLVRRARALAEKGETK